MPHIPKEASSCFVKHLRQQPKVEGQETSQMSRGRLEWRWWDLLMEAMWVMTGRSEEQLCSNYKWQNFHFQNEDA